MKAINISEKFNLFKDQWTPKKIGELNGQQVLLARLKGEFIWHSHSEEDELFLIIKGKLLIKFREGEIHLDEGELCIIPKGVEHKPIANEEVQVLLFEPLSTKHTGDVLSELTVHKYESI